MSWALVRKFWWLPLLIALAGVVLWQRNTITDKSAKLAAAEVRVTDLTKANKTLSDFQAGLEKMRVDNDAIATAVAGKIQLNNTREIHTRVEIEKAVRDDPATRDWANQPIPDSVRKALRADRADNPAR